MTRFAGNDSRAQATHQANQLRNRGKHKRKRDESTNRAPMLSVLRSTLDNPIMMKQKQTEKIIPSDHTHRFPRLSNNSICTSLPCFRQDVPPSTAAATLKPKRPAIDDEPWVQSNNSTVIKLSAAGASPTKKQTLACGAAATKPRSSWSSCNDSYAPFESSDIDDSEANGAPQRKRNPVASATTKKAAVLQKTRGTSIVQSGRHKKIKGKCASDDDRKASDGVDESFDPDGQVQPSSEPRFVSSRDTVKRRYTVSPAVLARQRQLADKKATVARAKREAAQALERSGKRPYPSSMAVRAKLWVGPLPADWQDELFIKVKRLREQVRPNEIKRLNDIVANVEAWVRHAYQQVENNNAQQRSASHEARLNVCRCGVVCNG